MRNESEIRVWDPFVRLFHWATVALFTIAFVTEDELLTLHVWAGYLLLALLGMRIVWGFVGTRHARFSDFVRPPATVLAYLKDVVAFRAPRHLGHNPAGGLMVIALMAALATVGVTGLLTYAAGEGAGPLAGLVPYGSRYDHWLEELHEFAANATLVLVGLHVGGVVIASLQHRENLVRAMFSGRKPAAR